jgi:hypothetical protein
MSIEEFIAQLAISARMGRVGGYIKERGWAAWGLFGNEFAVFLKGMYVELFICC